jgi:polysaccharide biosynthesis protein PslJ
LPGRVLPGEARVFANVRLPTGGGVVVPRRSSDTLAERLPDRPKGFAGVVRTELRAEDLEPSLVSAETYVTRRRATYIDAAALLSIMVCLLTLIPARYILPGMTDLGRPALVVGFLLFFWWMLAHVSPRLSMTGPQPLRWAFFGFFAALMISYAVGYLRGLTSIEAGGADRTMLYFCVFGGVLLTAADGIPNWFRLRGLLKVLVACATIVAAIALVQYVTKYDLTKFIVIPGLQAKGWTPTFEERGTDVRVASTTTHYIELAAFLATCLPFAIHFALFSKRPQRRRLAIISALIMLGGVAATISRTGMLGIGVLVLVLVPVWTWRQRYNVLIVALAGLAVAGAGNPGLIRTLFHLFDNPSDNPAFTVRQARYPLAFHYIGERPWLGRGTGTWISPQYQIMDNQWLDWLLSNGIVGTVAIAVLHITGIVLASMAWKRATRPEDKHLAAILVSTQVMGMLVAGTFDSMSFLTYATTLALTLGLCGTVWRLTHPARTIRTSSTRWFTDNLPSRTPTTATAEPLTETPPAADREPATAAAG